MHSRPQREASQLILHRSGAASMPVRIILYVIELSDGHPANSAYVRSYTAAYPCIVTEERKTHSERRHESILKEAVIQWYLMKSNLVQPHKSQVNKVVCIKGNSTLCCGRSEWRFFTRQCNLVTKCFYPKFFRMTLHILCGHGLVV